MTVTVKYRAECIEPGCDWRCEGPRADREAEKHGKKEGHATRAIGRPDPGPPQPRGSST